MKIIHQKKLSVVEARDSLLTLLGPDAMVSLDNRRGTLSQVFEVLDNHSPTAAIAYVRQAEGNPDKNASIRFFYEDKGPDQGCDNWDLQYCVEQIANTENPEKTHFHRRHHPIREKPYAF